MKEKNHTNILKNILISLCCLKVEKKFKIFQLTKLVKIYQMKTFFFRIWSIQWRLDYKN